MSQPALPSVTSSRFLGQTAQPSAAFLFGIIALGVCLLTVSAKVHVPFWPVPMTLQTMAVMGLAIACGPRIAFATMATYIAAGAAGLPVFAGSPERGLSLSYLAGPTGGYLAGFAVATLITGTLAQGRGAAGRTIAMLVGMIPVYALGVAWLALFVPASSLLKAGVTPFILGDLVKILAVALISVAIPAPLARMWSRIR